MRFDKGTIGSVLETVSKEYSDRTAIIFEDVSVSYKEIHRKSNIVACNLWNQGIRKDDKVAVLLPNCLEYFYIYYALFIIGAWIVPINTRYEKDEIKRIFKDGDVGTIIYKNKIGVFNYDSILSDINAELPMLKKFISTKAIDNKKRILLVDLFKENCDMKGFMDYLIKNPVEPDNVAILGYTSGTTGIPKGVMILHENLVKTSIHEGVIMDLGKDVGFSIAPMYAAQGFNAILIYMTSGITMKWISTFNPTDIITHIVKKRVNALHTQPTMWSLLLSLPYFQYVFFKNLDKVIVSGSLCSPNLAKRIEKSTGCKLVNIYGLIESTGVVTSTHLDDPVDVRINTVGRPIDGVQIKIVDNNRKEVPKGEVGELAVKGYLMKGYYKNKEKTDEVIDDNGWLYTGDLASYYKDGENICIVGRLKDMIIRGGFNVYPIDIEECLLGFDKVLDIAVVAKEDEILGESIVAYVIPKPGEEIEKTEILKYCRGKISNYKVPDEVVFVSQFPILDSGKVQKNILQQWTKSQVPEEYRV